MNLTVCLQVEESTLSTLVAARQLVSRPRHGERGAERRRLRRVDTLSARLAELHAIDDLLEQTGVVVSAGWVRGAWFTVARAGGERAVTAYDLGTAMDHPVSGACLVGAVAHAAGGPASVRSQLVQRTLDVTWHALREDPHRAVAWCPGPSVRRMHVLDLTRWNDAPHRVRGDVLALLRTARETARIELRRCRDERMLLTSQ